MYTAKTNITVAIILNNMILRDLYFGESTFDLIKINAF